MTPTRAQLDAVEAWLLEEWRGSADISRSIAEGKYAQGRWGRMELASRRDTRARFATAIRAIRAQRKALDAECNGWQLVHVNELAALRASMEFACLTPDEDCECAGCMAAAESERETT